MDMPHTVTDQLGLIQSFLDPIRENMSKEAAEDNSVSFKDTDAATPQNQAKQDSTPVSTDQRSLGNEQSQEAKDGGGNVETVADNTEEKGKDFADDQGPKTLDTDQTLKAEGNAGPMRGQEITQEQKEARATALGNSILVQLEKAAAEKCSCGEAGCPKCKSDGKKGGEGEYGDDYQNNMAADSDKEASEEEKLFEKFASIANEYAVSTRDAFLHGMLKRAQDEGELAAVADQIDPTLLEKVGGISGLLDKVAEENPEAVLPEGVDMDSAEDETPIEGGEELALPEVAPAGEMIEEGAMPEGGGADMDLGGLASALDEAGVAPEEIAQAEQDLQAILEAGVAPEELAQALTEMDGAGAAEEAAPVEKLASIEDFQRRARVDFVKQLLTSN
jgi:hypothetical protein